MKSILMSINPEWVEKILNGNKTVEVRKTRPKIDTPFKVYIYCTKSPFYAYYKHCTLEQYGKVIAEFTCDKIENIDIPYPAYFKEVKNKEQLEKDTCLTLMQMHHYLGTNIGYAWHITDLKIYDEPKPISEFGTHLDCYQEGDFDKLGCWECCEQFDNGQCTGKGFKPLTKAPQSWCYVEELK